MICETLCACQCKVRLITPTKRSLLRKRLCRNKAVGLGLENKKVRRKKIKVNV